MTDIRGALDELKARAEIDERVTAHYFRHTYASVRCPTQDRGAAVASITVATELGHQGLDQFEKVYGHLLKSPKRLPEVRYPRHGRGSGASPLHPPSRTSLSAVRRDRFRHCSVTVGNRAALSRRPISRFPTGSTGSGTCYQRLRGCARRTAEAPAASHAEGGTRFRRLRGCAEGTTEAPTNGNTGSGTRHRRLRGCAKRTAEAPAACYAEGGTRTHTTRRLEVFETHAHFRKRRIYWTLVRFRRHCTG